MIRDCYKLKKAVFFSPIRIPVAIVKSVKTQVASNVCSGNLPAAAIEEILSRFRAVPSA
jgi:hypothetical protein